MNDPLAPPPITRTPDTVFLLGMVLLAGLGQLLRSDEDPPKSVEIIGAVVSNAWSMSLVFTAAIILIGISITDEILGMGFELVGRIVLAGSCLAYSALYIYLSHDFTLSVALVIGLFGSSIWRVVQILQDLKRKRRAVDILLDDQAGES